MDSQEKNEPYHADLTTQEFRTIDKICIYINFHLKTLN